MRGNARPPDPRLLCGNGHPVDRLKKMKAWQGRLHVRECVVCGGALAREEERWACSGHCGWHVCRRCYDQHWTALIQRAARTEDEKLRRTLLSAVPEVRRKGNDFLAAEQARKAPTVADWLASVPAASSGVPAKSLRAGPPDAAPAWQERLKLRDERVQVALWLAAGAAATGLAFWAASELLRNEDLAFPHPFHLEGLSQLGALLLCRLAARILDAGKAAPPPPPVALRAGPPGAPSAEAEEWKAAGIFGLMYGVESCIGASLLYHFSIASRDAAYVLTPAVMLGAGILAGCDKPERRCFLSIVGVTLGGLLMVFGGFEWDLFEIGLLALLADAVKMFRWVFTRNVLPQSGGVPLLIFAARLTTSTAALGFELAFFADFDGYTGLLSLPYPGKVAALVLATSLGLAVALVSELHLAQLTSVTVLGFLTPLMNVVLTLTAAIAGGTGASWVGCLGALICLGGLGFYGYLRQNPQEADVFIAVEPPVSSTGYVRLQADGPQRYQQQLRPPPPTASWGGSPGSVASRSPARSPGQSPRGHSPRPSGPQPQPNPGSARGTPTAPRLHIV